MTPAPGARSRASLHDVRPGLPAVRAGIEMALLDALGHAWEVPLYRFFGGAGDRVVTDITVSICPPEEAEALAAGYRARGFSTIKSKLGRDVAADVERLAAIRRGHPDCALVIDANEGYTAQQALDMLVELRANGLEPALFEQPVVRDDWNGLGRVTREGGVPVAADESCRDPRDALRIAREGLATVLNIKLAKAGVVAALEVAAIAPRGGARPDDRRDGGDAAGDGLRRALRRRTRPLRLDRPRHATADGGGPGARRLRRRWCRATAWTAWRRGHGGTLARD